MTIAFTVLLWIVCVLIIAVVLLQTGKGGGMAGVFGGGAGPESLLGTRATSFLVKVTVVLCLLFLTICLTMGRMGKRSYNRSKYETPTGEGGTPETVEKEKPNRAAGDKIEIPDVGK